MRHHTFPALLLIAAVAFTASPSGRTAQGTPPQANAASAVPAGLAEYRFGTPSGDEVEVLELINRSRANPPAEGQRLAAAMHPVDYGIYPGSGAAQFVQALYYTRLNEILTSFASYPARPPLAFNAQLNASAQAHVADMVATGVQQHNSSDGTSADARVASFGYTLFGGENITGGPYRTPSDVASAFGIEFEYETDFNNAQPGIGHRLAIMEPHLCGNVEVGIAERAIGGWSTQDFGFRYTPPLLTGAVFNDDARSGFFASGEGVSNVLVTSDASSYYARTVNGAYSLPLDLAGRVYAWGYQYTYDVSTKKVLYSPINPAPVATVTFTDPQGNAVTRSVALTHTENLDPAAADPSIGYTGVSSAFDDDSGTPRWDNAKADWVLPATGPVPTPTPAPTPTPTPKPAADVTIAAVPGSGFVVTRTGDTGHAVAVVYKAKGTAVAGRDYLTLPGTKVIKAGKGQALIRVTPLPGAAGTLKLVVVPTSNYNAPPPGQAKLRLSGTP